MTAITNALLSTTTYEWTEHPYSAEERTEWVKNQEVAGRPVLVADDEGEVVGWTSYGDFRDSALRPGYRFTVENSIHVGESQWGRGIGWLLMSSLIDHARSDGKRVMVAAIDSSNKGAIGFHTRLGFQEVARMPGIGDKWGQRLDLVLMQKML